jgi:hypothetical protein
VGGYTYGRRGKGYICEKYDVWDGVVRVFGDCIFFLICLVV